MSHDGVLLTAVQAQLEAEQMTPTDPVPAAEVKELLVGEIVIGKTGGGGGGGDGFTVTVTFACAWTYTVLQAVKV